MHCTLRVPDVTSSSLLPYGWVEWQCHLTHLDLASLSGDSEECQCLSTILCKRAWGTSFSSFSFLEARNISEGNAMSCLTFSSDSAHGTGCEMELVMNNNRDVKGMEGGEGVQDGDGGAN